MTEIFRLKTKRNILKAEIAKLARILVRETSRQRPFQSRIDKSREELMKCKVDLMELENRIALAELADLSLGNVAHGK